MKSVLALVIFANVLLTWNANAQTNTETHPSVLIGWTDEQREVWRVIEEWNNAFENNDAARYFTFVHPDITVLTQSNPYRIEGLTADRREFEFGIKRGYSKVSLFQELQPHVVVHGDMAFATYFNRGWYGPEDAGAMIYLKETDVLMKHEGKWKIVHIHVSTTN